MTVQLVQLTALFTLTFRSFDVDKGLVSTCDVHLARQNCRDQVFCISYKHQGLKIAIYIIAKTDLTKGPFRFRS
jgi:hypothetical protein